MDHPQCVRREKHDPKSREKASNRNRPPECPRCNYQTRTLMQILEMCSKT